MSKRIKQEIKAITEKLPRTRPLSDMKLPEAEIEDKQKAVHQLRGAEALNNAYARAIQFFVLDDFAKATPSFEEQTDKLRKLEAAEKLLRRNFLGMLANSSSKPWRKFALDFVSSQMLESTALGVLDGRPATVDSIASQADVRAYAGDQTFMLGDEDSVARAVEMVIPNMALCAKALNSTDPVAYLNGVRDARAGRHVRPMINSQPSRRFQRGLQADYELYDAASAWAWSVGALTDVRKLRDVQEDLESQYGSFGTTVFDKYVGRTARNFESRFDRAEMMGAGGYAEDVTGAWEIVDQVTLYAWSIQEVVDYVDPDGRLKVREIALV